MRCHHQRARRQPVFQRIDDLAFGDLVEMLKSRFGDRDGYPAKTALPADMPRYIWDTGRSKKELGLSYRPLEPALAAMFEKIEARAV